MEKDLNSLGAQLDLKHQQTNFSGHINRSAYMAVPNDDGTLPVSGFSNEQHGWFYGLPRYRQAFTTMLNPSSREKANVGSLVPDSVYDSAQDNFLVLDQTRDQTTLIFSSGIRTPVEFPTSWNPKLPDVDNLREDTEELNALLYSDEDDSDDYSDDDEVTSRDHTLCTTTFHDSQELFDGWAEQVASSDEPHSDAPSRTNTDCSVKRKRSISSEYNDDAQSTCVQSDENVFASYGKKSKKERIRDNLNLLQSIIPCGEGKAAIDILDEAITYLQSLRK